MGVVVGKCEIVDIVDGKKGQRFGKWFFGPKGWVIKNSRRFSSSYKNERTTRVGSSITLARQKGPKEWVERRLTSCLRIDLSVGRAGDVKIHIPLLI